MGVNSLQQLKEIVDAYSRIQGRPASIDFSQYAVDNELIIDPRKW